MVAVATAVPSPSFSFSPGEIIDVVATRSRASLRKMEETGSLVYGPGSCPRDGWVMVKYGTKRERTDAMVCCREHQPMTRMCIKMFDLLMYQT